MAGDHGNAVVTECARDDQHCLDIIPLSAPVSAATIYRVITPCIMFWIPATGLDAFTVRPGKTLIQSGSIISAVGMDITCAVDLSENPVIPSCIHHAYYQIDISDDGNKAGSAAFGLPPPDLNEILTTDSYQLRSAEGFCLMAPEAC